MTTTSRSFAFVIFIATLVFSSSLAEAQRRQRYPVPTGKTHPEFKLPAVTDGKPVSLSDFRGKKTILVHFASW